MNNIMEIVVLLYLIWLAPVIIMLLLGLSRLYSRPESAKKLFIAAGIYFMIGGGICRSMIS